jgi:hypothetical protein
MSNVTYTTLSVPEPSRVAVLVNRGQIEIDEHPSEKAAEALDSDRVPGTVKPVVTES